MERWATLDTACKAIAARDPILQRAIRESWEECAASLDEEISRGLGAVLGDRVKVAESAQNNLDELLKLYDLALLHISDLAYFGWKHADARASLIWPDAALPKRPSRNSVFYVLASNLSQAMQAFRLVSIHGYEHQARNILRNIVELADMMTMVLASQDFYHEYIKSFDNDAKTQKHWREKLSPAVVRAKLEGLDLIDPIKIPIDDTPHGIRKGMYDWLSKFTHNNFVAHIVAVHPEDCEGASGRLAMLGVVGSMSRATFAHGLVYFWITLTRLQRLLWKEHRWGRFKGDRSRLWFRYRFAVLDEAFSNYLPMFWENEPDSMA